MVLLTLVVIATLFANASPRLRASALAFGLIAVAANVIALPGAPLARAAVLACAGIVAAALLYLAAGDPAYGEPAGRRLWVAMAIAAVATPTAFVSFRAPETDPGGLPLFGGDQAGAAAQVAAFWLLSAGTAVLVTARGAARASLGALLMTTGVQPLVQLAPGPQLPLTLLVAWVEVVIALTGAFLVVNERAVRAA
jgi:hypothetical protein